MIFKNQAMNQKEKSGQFVNDLLRTEFHKCVFVLGRFTILTDVHAENSWQSLSRCVSRLSRKLDWVNMSLTLQ